VAEAIVQLEAPGTVGPPEFADDPGAVGAGGVAGWSGCCSPSAGACSWPPVVSEDTVAFAVDRACTSGEMMFAFGSVEAPELVTAWHTPPETPSQEPSLREPRACADTLGSVALAALVTLPVQAAWPWQTRVAPAADAADGPAANLAVLTCWACPFACGPDSASAAPGPVDAVDTDRTWQSPVPAVQDAVPSDVRGLPPATAPSQALVVVRTDPWQAAPASHARLADDVAVDDGPDSDWPGSGRPVFGSTATKSGALDAAELVRPSHRPPVTVHSAVEEVPRACGVTPVSRALVELFAVPPHSVAAPEHCTVALACDTLTGPDTCATPVVAPAAAGSRSATVVSAAVVHVPPAPCAVQDDVPVLSRTPFTSPAAPPDVVLDPAAAQLAAAQSTSVPAVLEADSSRVARVAPVATAASRSSQDGSAARSDTCESDRTPQPPAFASHCEEALVVRTGAPAPAFAGVPVAPPVVALDAFPLQPAVAQSTFAPAELDAVASPSVSTAARAAPTRRSSRSSTWLSTRVLLYAWQPLPADSQEARPLLVRSAAVIPRVLPAVVVVPVPVQPAPQSTSTTASLLPPLPAASASSAPDRLRVEHPPPDTLHSALPLVADSAPPASAAAATVSVLASWPASVRLLAEPVQAAAQSTSASATTSSVESSSPRSTAVVVPQPAAPSQCAVLLPCRRARSVSAASASSVPARVGRSLPDPVLLLSQLPPAVSHPASAPSRSATASVPHTPVHAARAAVRRSAPSGAAAPSRAGPEESVRQPPPPDPHSAEAPSRSARLD
jgi:hypothetical protein